MHLVDRVERRARVQRIVQLKCELRRFRCIPARLEVLDHLQRLGDIGDLLLEALAPLRRADLHELVLGDGLLELLQRRHHILVSATDKLGHVRDKRGRGDAPLLRRGVHGHRGRWAPARAWSRHVDMVHHVLNVVLQRKSLAAPPLVPHPTVVAMSTQDLQWLLVRKSNRYLVKQKGLSRVFSREPGNLASLHSYKVRAQRGR